MALSDILNKMSPVGNKITRDMSESEYMRLVDRNTELFDENKELHEEIERLNNIIKLKTDFIAELLKIILVARDYELHEKCEVRAKLYEEKLQELKGSNKQ